MIRMKREEVAAREQERVEQVRIQKTRQVEQLMDQAAELRKEQRLLVRVLVAPLTMLLPLAMAVQPLTTGAPAVLAASTAVALAGTLWSLVSLAYLGLLRAVLPPATSRTLPPPRAIALISSSGT